MMKRTLLIPALALTLIGVTGCAKSLDKAETQPASKWPSYESAEKNNFIPTNHAAADQLIAQLQNTLPAGSGPLLVATLANIDILEQSSTLGRMVSEQVSSRFTRHGYKMVEMKFGNSIYMRHDQGEMMLTREVQELARTYNAKAVIVGTYGESRNYVFINLKVVQPNTNAILAVHDYALPADSSVSSMLRSKRL